MSGSDESRTITGWQTASRFDRRPPGTSWVLALVAVPLLLGFIGWGALNRANSDGELTLPEVNPTATLTAPEVDLPNPSFSPLSIVRSGGNVTLSGAVPDIDAKNRLLEWLRGKFGADVTLIDDLNLTPGVNSPDVPALGTVFDAAGDAIPDFGCTIEGNTVTLTGAAATAEARDAVEAAARTAWPNLDIANTIQVAAATAMPAPAPGPPGPCAVLQGEVTALLHAPITFGIDGFVLVPASQQLLTQVADKLKTCPGAQVAVTGYTDNSGNDAINVPLSADRAKAVADYLVSQGLPVDHVTSSGAGSANPIAGNDTPEGRAQNRRVEITVN